MQFSFACGINILCAHASLNSSFQESHFLVHLEAVMNDPRSLPLLHDPQFHHSSCVTIFTTEPIHVLMNRLRCEDA